MSDLEPNEAQALSLGPGGLHHNAKKVVLFFLKYVVGISLIAWMALSGKLDFSVVASLPGSLVLECVALMVVQSILAAIRVKYILAHQRIATTLTQSLLFNCAGILYSAFLPGGISGDAVRAYLFMKANPGHRLAILGALVLDRLLGLVSMVVLGLVAALYMAITVPLVRPYLVVFAAILFALVAGIGVLHVVGRGHKSDDVPLASLPGLWSKFRRGIAELRVHEYGVAVLLSVVAQSMVIHLTAVAVIYLCSLHAASGLGFLQVFVATPIGLLVNAIPLSPGGLGIGENAFELLYRAIGGSQGATSFLIARFFLYAPALVGLVYIIRRLAFRRKHP